MKLIKLLIVLSFFTACCPQIIPVSNNTVVTHDTIVKYVPRDTTIYLPGKTTTINAGVNCDSLNRAQMKEVVIKKDGMTETAEIKDGKLIATCTEDSLKLVIKLRDKTIEALNKTVTDHVNNVVITKPTGFDIFLRWFFGLELLLLIIGLIIKFK